MNRKDMARETINMIGIMLGALITAFSVQGFIVAAGLAGGGIGGIALLLYYSLGLPIGLMTFVLNVPLFILGWKEVNRRFIAKTLLGLGVFALSLDLLQGIRPLPFEDLFLGALYGGIIGGVGSGLVYRLGGSLGGTDIIAKVVQRKFGLAMGSTQLLLNVVIMLFSWAMLGPKVALYTLVSMYAFSKTVDLIQGGLPAKAVTIISSQSEVLVDRIIKDVGRGATFLQGRGAYSAEEKNVIICVVGLTELGRLKQVVREVDDKAFMIVQNASEVLGQGFMIND